MSDAAPILARVRAAAARRLLFLPHAARQMARPERLISAAEVRVAVEWGELVEDYPDDVRGHSCLLLGFGERGRAIHVVCAPKDEYLPVITAYAPDPGLWAEDSKTRRRT